ncbi:hypothetical protein GMORB2_0604 [Geosmithia morbida]|uniref:Regulator of phospholipase D SRF1 n=1 Tax=Geosmithia morbida TaxID=1094350 RepID=A0A9P4Z2A8_9HYPO|nr:uncharacterized protein GMORB2_0604 [Geosmithia morbida]KAF4126867.1 hypothetical protein GMORB2_0604 [Geosmithia morbida]
MSPPSPSQPPRSRGTQGTHSSLSGEASSVNIAAGTTSQGTTTSRSRLRPPRTLPPWIASYTGVVPPTAEQLALLQVPATVRAHQNNSTPSEPERKRISHDGFVDLEDGLGPGKPRPPLVPHILRYGRAPRGGRRWDHLRTAEPVIVPAYGPAMAHNNHSRGGDVAWGEFVRSSAWGRAPGEDGVVVDAAYLEKLQPLFGQDPDGAFNEQTAQRSKRRSALALNQRAFERVLRHPLAPLAFRLVVMVTSITALAIAGRIFLLLDRGGGGPSVERSQSITAIVVDCVAVPYLGYMIYDEYTGQPLGLRSGISKVSLIMLDVIFIIFKAASTALAFQSLVFNDITATGVRPLAAALAAFLLIALVVWTVNFTVNILRTVERLGGRDNHLNRGPGSMPARPALRAW